MQHIETIELASSQASITFSSIPQDYDDLLLKVSLRSNRSGELERYRLVFNSDTSNNYSYKALVGTGSSVFTEGITTNGIISYGATATNATLNTFGNSSFFISNYKASQSKSVSHDGVWEDNNTNAWSMIIAALWSSNSAIASIQIVPDFGTAWVTGSTASLYGVTAGGDGTVTTA